MVSAVNLKRKNIKGENSEAMPGPWKTVQKPSTKKAKVITRGKAKNSSQAKNWTGGAGMTTKPVSKSSSSTVKTKPVVTDGSQKTENGNTTEDKEKEEDEEPEPLKLFSEVSTSAAMDEARIRLRRECKRKRNREDRRDKQRGFKKSRGSDLNEEQMFDMVVSKRCKENIEIYKSKWIELIDIEQREDQKEVEARLQKMTLQQLVHRGMAIIDLDIELVPKRRTWDDLPIYKLTGEIPPSASEPGISGGHRFENGDLVLISEIDPLLEDDCFEGVIVGCFSDKFLIGLRENPGREFDMTRVRIDKGPNKITFERMVEALQHMTGPTFSGSEVLRNVICRLSPEFLPDSHKPKSEDDADIDGDDDCSIISKPPKRPSQSVEMITTKKHPKPFPKDEPFDMFDNSRFLSTRERRLLNAKIDEFRVNPSQAEAILTCFEQRFSLIQGPPGTGKTTCSVKLIVMAVKVLKEVPILASAFSNVAVDQIMAGLVEHGIKVVRLGQPGRVTRCLEDVTLHAKMQSHKNWGRVEREKDKLRSTEQSIQERKREMMDFSILLKTLNQQKKVVRDLEWQIRDNILDEAEVICATCIGSGSPLLKDRSFKLVLIDECTQATEPSTIIPICKAKGRVILIGDQHQLPPVIRAEALRGSGLEMGLFDRMIHQQKDGLNMGITATMLRRQYRMHPLISKFPRQEIYKGDLADGIDASIRPPPEGFPWGPNGPVAFLQTVTRESSQTGMSKYNVGEADLILDIIDNLLFGTVAEREKEKETSAQQVLQDWDRARKKAKNRIAKERAEVAKSLREGRENDLINAMKMTKEERIAQAKKGLELMRKKIKIKKEAGEEKVEEHENTQVQGSEPPQAGGVQVSPREGAGGSAAEGSENVDPNKDDEEEERQEDGGKDNYQQKLPKGASLLIGPDGAPIPNAPVLLGLNGKPLPPGTSVTIDKYGTARDKYGRPLPSLPPLIVQGTPKRKLLPSEIGIVTPYADQVRLLKRLFDRKGGRREGQKYEGLEIRSVDGYQGREKEVIIFSTVRSNHFGGIGFLKDRRRINVAITRARRGLIVTGNRQTLDRDPTWYNWLQFVDEHLIEVDVADVYRYMNRKVPSSIGGDSLLIEQKMRQEWNRKQRAVKAYRNRNSGWGNRNQWRWGGNRRGGYGGNDFKSIFNLGKQRQWGGRGYGKGYRGNSRPRGSWRS